MEIRTIQMTPGEIEKAKQQHGVIGCGTQMSANTQKVYSILETFLVGDWHDCDCLVDLYEAPGGFSTYGGTVCKIEGERVPVGLVDAPMEVMIQYLKTMFDQIVLCDSKDKAEMYLSNKDFRAAELPDEVAQLVLPSDVGCLVAPAERLGVAPAGAEGWGFFMMTDNCARYKR